MLHHSGPERVETVVVGAGQAGLSVGYHLARRGRELLILEQGKRVGDSWRERWDSLRLFSPARFDGLDGWPFPAPPNVFPTKDAMGDYLEAYAARFQLPVRTGERVTGLSRTGDRYTVTTERDGRFEAEHVVVAMANYQRPKVPDLSRELSSAITQIHSRDYRNPSQLRPGGVLIVGAGNSGAEIAAELARGGQQVWMSGRNVGQLPFRIDGLAARLLLTRVMFRAIFHRVLTTGTPMGRTVRSKVLHKGGPLIRTKWKDLAAAGVERVGKTVGARDGRPLLEDGRVIEPANIIWCTGFNAGHSWIDLPVFGDDGEPMQDRGVVRGEPGLYFVGLHFLYALSSAMIHGVGRDADHVAGVIAKRREPRPHDAAHRQ